MINNHVVSLELSKRLEKLGVKKESEFYWNKKRKVTRVKHIKKYYCYLSEASTEVEGYDIVGRNVSAFLSSELGEKLGSGFNLFKTSPGAYGYKKGEEWMCDNNAPIGDDEYVYMIDDTPQNAQAKMLIHLIENSIIDVKSL